jgi:DNA invertase Pin-like site-specific DNA recombinase
MKKLVGYCRVSTDNQREEGTISIQHKALTQYCESNGYELIETFSDNGISGAKDLEGRAGLAGCFDFIETHSEVCAILVYKMDRFSRDMFTTEFLLRKLKALHKGIISVTEPYIENDGGDALKTAFRQFLTIVSQLERSFITLRLSAGRINKARKGGYAGGSPPLGYKAEGKELLIDTESVETVKTIFSLREKGYTLREIASFLNNNNIPSARNGRWCFQSVSYMLKNPLYQGKSCYSGSRVNRQDLALII